MGWVRGRSYSQDLRERVLEAEGMSARQVAARFAVSASYVIKVRQRRDRTGEVSTKRRGYRRPPLITGLEQALAREVERRSSATLADLRAWLLTTHGVSLSTGAMWQALRTLGLTLKKSRSEPPSRCAKTSPLPASNGAHCNAD